MDIAELNLSVRTFNALCRAGIRNVQDLSEWYQYRLEDLQMWVGKRALAEIGDALAKFAKTKEEPMADHKTTIIVTDDYTRAVTLTRSIIANAQAAQQSLYEVCKGLKEMRDGKLYKELGYQNFEDYTEHEVGIKRRQAYGYISVAENLPTDFVHSSAQIGIKKLELLAKLDEPTREAVTESVDVESVTVRELKAQISALTQERDENEHAAELLSDELDSARQTIESKDRQFKAAMESKNREVASVRDASEKSQKSYTNRIMKLEEQIRELENRPVEVAVSEKEAKEIERLKGELEDAKMRLLQAERGAEMKAENAAAAVRAEYEAKAAQSDDSGSAGNEAAFYALREIFDKVTDDLDDLLDECTAEQVTEFLGILERQYKYAILCHKQEEAQHDSR